MALVALPPLKALGSRRRGCKKASCTRAGLRKLFSPRCTYDDAEAVQNALFQRKIEVPVKVLSEQLYVRVQSALVSLVGFCFGPHSSTDAVLLACVVQASLRTSTTTLRTAPSCMRVK